MAKTGATWIWWDVYRYWPKTTGGIVIVICIKNNVAPPCQTDIPIQVVGLMINVWGESSLFTYQNLLQDSPTILSSDPIHWVNLFTSIIYVCISISTTHLLWFFLLCEIHHSYPMFAHNNNKMLDNPIVFTGALKQFLINYFKNILTLIYRKY